MKVICPQKEYRDKCSECRHFIPHSHIEENDDNRNSFTHCDHVNKSCPACVKIKEMEFLTSKEMQL